MIQYPQIDPVAFTVASHPVHWYGLMYLLGFACAYLLLRYRGSKQTLAFTPQQISDLIFYAAIGVMAGGRIGYFLFYTPPSEWLIDPLAILKIWEGGMSFHGGLIGVITSMWLWGRHIQKPFFQIMDLCAIVAPIGLGLGRLGNFIGNELWGRQTSDLPWAMVFPGAGTTPRHPSQLYEMLLEGALLFALLWVISLKPRPRGLLSGIFLLGYGTARFFVEFFREPDAHMGFIAFNWMTMGHLLCTPMIICGVTLIYFSLAHINTNQAFSDKKAQQI